MSVRLGNNIIAGAGGGGGGGAVDSVNGKTGVVVLDASDVGALPDSTSIPTESTVSGWGFTKNEGTVTSVNNVQPTNGNVTLNIPTVNDSTITVTQGGVTKGTFTLNQANASTIALDAGAPGDYHPDLFDYKWADHICNDVQWLRADTYSWQDSGVYEAAYNHLVEDVEEIIPAWTWLASGVGSVYTAHRNPAVGDKAYSDTDLTVEAGDITEVTSGSITVNSTVYNMNGHITGNISTETVAGITINYYQSSDGHKIIQYNQITQAEQIYAATGSSWYYILDYMNQRFKLPRAKPLTGGVIGNGMTLGLTNGTLNGGLQTWNANSLCVYTENYGTAVNTQKYSGGTLINDSNYTSFGLTTEAENSGIIAERDNTDQYKYLYFYVGNFTQTALENTAGVTTETLNEKADVDLANVSANGVSTLFATLQPDFTAGVVKTANVTHTATEDGWVWIFEFSMGERYFYIDGVQIKLGAGNGTAGSNSGNGVLIPIAKGHTYSGNSELTFFPIIGV